MSWSMTPLLPAWAALTALHPRLRRDLGERWGWQVAPVQPGAVWVHAASVGEVGAAAALAGHLPGPVLLTSDTDTGAARARALVSGAREIVAGVRPVDHPLAIAPLWSDARPRLLVFVEGAWWPALARVARAHGVAIARVSARAGPRTRKVPAAIYRRWVRGTRLVLARDAHEAAWFRAHQDAPVEIGGDLKLSAQLPPSTLSWARPRIVGASTRAGDEEALLAARPPGHQLLLAPRHPERFDEVAGLLARSGLRWARRSQLGDRVPPELEVVLLDSVGELPALVGGAAALFVGGTFDPAIGGHSAAEAARAGVPVVAGPERWANATSFDAALLVEAPTPSDLAGALRHAVTRTAAPVTSAAAARTAERLQTLLCAPAPETSPRPWAYPLTPRVGAAPVRRERLDVPVIAVGSESARGSGKTSTARWFAARLVERGHRVGVVVHGYRRGRGGRAVRTSTDGVGWQDLGDEGALYASDGHLVAAGRDRRAAAARLIAAGASVIVLDDALHDGSLVHDRRILVVDARFPTGRGRLPAGEGRAVGSVDAVVVHHARPLFQYAAPGLPTVLARRSGGAWHPARPEGPVAAFAGIGRAADLLETIEAEVARFRALPDHQPVGARLAEELLRWADGLPLVCTDKDAVRLAQPLRERVAWRALVLDLGPEALSWLP